MLALLVTTDCDFFLVLLMLSQFNCFAAIFRMLRFVFVFVIVVVFVVFVFLLVMVCAQIAMKFHLATCFAGAI